MSRASGSASASADDRRYSFPLSMNNSPILSRNSYNRLSELAVDKGQGDRLRPSVSAAPSLENMTRRIDVSLMSSEYFKKEKVRIKFKSLEGHHFLNDSGFPSMPYSSTQNPLLFRQSKANAIDFAKVNKTIHFVVYCQLISSKFPYPYSSKMRTNLSQDYIVDACLPSSLGHKLVYFKLPCSVWEEVIEFPIYYHDLSLDAYIHVEIVGAGDKLIGDLNIPLFDKELLKQGIYEVELFDVFENETEMFKMKKITMPNKNSGSWLDEMSAKRMDEIKWETRSNRSKDLFPKTKGFRSPVYFTFQLPSSSSHIIYDALVNEQVQFKQTNQAKSTTSIKFIPDPAIDCKLDAQQASSTLDPFDVWIKSNPQIDISKEDFAKQLKPTLLQKKDIKSYLRNSETLAKTKEGKVLMKWFRYSLTNEKLNFAKFVNLVQQYRGLDIEDIAEVLSSWDRIDMKDIVLLLSYYSDNASIINLVVNKLEYVSDEELSFYFPQLVQVFRTKQVERHPASIQHHENHHLNKEQLDIGPFGKYLFARAKKSVKLSLSLFRVLMQELSCKKEQGIYDLTKVFINEMKNEKLEIYEQDKLLSVFSWKEFEKRNIEGLREKLQSYAAASAISNEKGMRRKNHDFIIQGHPIPSPLDPNVTIKNFNPKFAVFLNSNAKPLVLEFEVEGKEEKMMKVMYKEGDDLRQDQIIIQIFRAMNQILLDNGLDTHFVSYNVICTEEKKGLVEFVPHSEKLDTWDPSPLQKDHKKRIRFIKSSAASSVFTYLLGVGDRHTENIMVTEKGELFHIDFGFAFGQDPKVNISVRITEKMKIAMGGEKSPEYKLFLSLCKEIFRILRRNASYIIALLKQMLRAGIPHLRATAINFVEDTFLLRYKTSEEAEAEFMRIIEGTLPEWLKSKYIDITRKIASTIA